MRTTLTLTLAVGAALALAGCGSAEPDQPAAAPETTQATEKAKPTPTAQTIETVTDLRDAYKAAGGVCPTFEQTNLVALASESASCDTATVLMVFDTNTARDANITTLHEMGTDVLVGDRWVINAPLDAMRAVARGMGAEVKQAPTPPPPPPAELGTRDNPAQPGELITYSEAGTVVWEVTVGHMDPDAWPEIQATNQFNDPPAEGTTFVMVPVTATYKGEGSGTPWLDVDVAFVAADGRSFDQAWGVLPDSLNDVADLYTGGTGTGNVAFEVPLDAIEGGTFAVSAGYADPVFIAALAQQ